MIDLQKFCSTNPKRKPLCQPWSDGEWTYATDARVMVRVPRRADVPENPGAPKKVNEHIFDGNPNDGKFRDVPKCEAPKQTECLNCKGHVECTCPMCSINPPCEECDGTKLVEETLPAVKFGEQLVSPKYLALIADLPGVMLANGTETYSGLTFKFDGGEGVIMPMRES